MWSLGDEGIRTLLMLLVRAAVDHTHHTQETATHQTIGHINQANTSVLNEHRAFPLIRPFSLCVCEGVRTVLLCEFGVDLSLL